MKNNILKSFILFLSVLVVLTVYLSTIGIETDKFNDQIKKRISLINKEIDIDLKKIISKKNNDVKILITILIKFYIKIVQESYQYHRLILFQD